MPGRINPPLPTRAQDQARTRFLERRGMKLLRFRDNEVLQQMEAVLEAILDAAHKRTLTPTPLTRKGTPKGSPEGEGLKSEGP